MRFVRLFLKYFSAVLLFVGAVALGLLIALFYKVAAVLLVALFLSYAAITIYRALKQ